MSKILIGQDIEKRNIHLDLDVLLRTRLLIQANSGGGKSWLLRRLAEQLFGKLPVLIIDPEGEFATLREKFGYVLVGKGGETPADPRSAALLAHKLLELRASAVCDLFEMKPAARHDWTQKFLDALIDAPKALWRPTIVIVDESAMFCPEKGAGESVASESMISLATRGRKRGFCPIWATQRLGNLRKDAAAQMLNVLIGPTFIDIDRKRAAETLGVAREDQREFFASIKVLESGNFFALGRAISLERVQVKIGPVDTTHPESGMSARAGRHAMEAPPPPERVRELLPKLADLPKEAEEKARTEAEFRAEIRALKAQLRAQPKTESRDPVAEERRMRAEAAKIHGEYREKIEKFTRGLRTYQQSMERFAQQCEFLATQHADLLGFWTEKTGEIKSLPQGPQGGAEESRKEVPAASAVISTSPRQPKAAENNGTLPPGERAILIAAAQMGGVDRRQATILTGYRRSSRDAYVARLRSKGLITLAGDKIVATEEGMAVLGQDYEELPTGTELADYWLARLPEGERKILKILLQIQGEPVNRESLDEATGYQRSSRDAYLSRLQAKKLIAVAGRGQVQASKELF